MENFPFDFNDLKNLIIGIMGYFLGKAIDRYWLHRTVRSIQRQIRYTGERKQIIDNLVQSDRSILLFSFRALFGILTAMSLYFITQPLLSLLNDGFSLNHWASVGMLLMIVIVSFYAAYILKQADNYPESTEAIHKKIGGLKEKLSKLTDSKDDSR